MTSDTQAALAGAGFTPAADSSWLAVGQGRRVEAAATADGGLELVGLGGGDRPVWRNQLASGYTLGMVRVLLTACARWVTTEPASPDQGGATDPVAPFGRHQLLTALARLDRLPAADRVT